MRAAEDATRSEKINSARKFFERQKWLEGVLLLQPLFDDEQDSLYFRRDFQWVPVSVAAIDLILEFPQGARSTYEDRFQAEADRALREAHLTQDVSALTKVAKRYLLTPAGQQAGRECLDFALDQGSDDAVIQFITDLVRIRSAQLDDPRWRTSLMECLKALGHSPLAEQLQTWDRSSSTAPDSGNTWNFDGFRSSGRQQENWTTVSGSPSGHGLPRTEDPALLPVWQKTLVAQPQVRRLLQEELTEIADTGRLGLSTLSSVGVDNVLVSRTLTQLTAFDISTGDVLWSSPNRLLRSSHPDDEEDIDPNDLQRILEQNHQQDVHELLDYQIQSQLMGNGNLGALSANSRFVFAIEMENRRNDIDLDFGIGEQPDEPTTTSIIVARELRTGKVIWRAGGVREELLPGLSAAGVFFFGPPTPDGDELFVLGEQGGDLRLFCIEEQTGLVRWSQLLGTPGRRIQDDPVRGQWAAPVAVRGSLVVCPTTTGWVTAVDRVSRSLVWSSRIPPRVKTTSDDSETELTFDQPNRQTTLDERWPPLQPMLLKDRVIVAPIEFPDEDSSLAPSLVCLNLNTGEKIWELPKSEMVGVIGADDKCVYLFNHNSIQAVDVGNGDVRGKCDIAEEIAGRPLLTANGIIVPTRAATLSRVVIQERGTLERRNVEEEAQQSRRLQQLQGGDNPRKLHFGNLIASGGRVISTSPLELTAFEWKSDEARWAAEATINPHSAWRWAMTLALRGDIKNAESVLRQGLALTETDGAWKSRFQKTLFAVTRLRMSEAMANDPAQVTTLRERLHEIRELATTVAEQEGLQRLEIDLSLRTADWATAWENLRKHVRSPLTQLVETGGTVVHPDNWVADRILELGRGPTGEQRRDLRDAIRAEFQDLWRAAGATPSEQQRLLRLFGETPLSDAAELSALTGPDEATAITRLQSLCHSRDPDVALVAALTLIERLTTPDWVGEARRRFRGLPPVAEWPENLRPRHAEIEQNLASIEDIHLVPFPAWAPERIEVQRTNISSNFEQPEIPIYWVGPPCEALTNFHYSFDQLLKQVILERVDGTRYGELSLISQENDSSEENVPQLYGAGLNLYAIYHGQIQAFSIPDRRRLWTKSSNSPETAGLYWNYFSLAQGRMVFPAQVRSIWEDQLRSRTLMQVETANHRQIVVRTRRGMEVISAVTGELLWELTYCPKGKVRCDEDRLYRFTDVPPAAYSIRSGRPLLCQDLEAFEQSLCPVNATGITSLKEQSEDERTWELLGRAFRGVPIPEWEGTPLQRWDEQDLLSLATTWRVALPSDSFLGSGPPGSGLIVNAAGDVKLLNWDSGHIESLGITPVIDKYRDLLNTEASGSLTTHWDRFQVFVAANSTSTERRVDIPSVRVYGTISAHSRHQKSIDWVAPAEGELLLNSIERFPCLSVLRLEPFSVAGIDAWRIHLTVFDKQTGAVLLQLNTPSEQGMARNCQYHPLTQEWDLFLQNERLRLRLRNAALPENVNGTRVLPSD